MKIYRPYGRCNISGERVREARERADLSQERLAYKIQIAGLDITQKAAASLSLSSQRRPTSTAESSRLTSRTTATSPGLS